MRGPGSASRRHTCSTCGKTEIFKENEQVVERSPGCFKDEAIIGGENEARVREADKIVSNHICLEIF